MGIWQNVLSFFFFWICQVGFVWRNKCGVEMEKQILSVSFGLGSCAYSSAPEVMAWDGWSLFTNIIGSCVFSLYPKKKKKERKGIRKPSREELSPCTWPVLLRDRNTALQILPNGIDHYKNTPLRLGKQLFRRTVKYHDSVVEVNIAWEAHITIVLSGGLKCSATLRVFSFMLKWAETKHTFVYLGITQVGSM